MSLTFLWYIPNTFTVATALAARTTTFKPLAAIRPGYWQPAHFASAAARPSGWATRSSPACATRR